MVIKPSSLFVRQVRLKNLLESTSSYIVSYMLPGLLRCVENDFDHFQALRSPTIFKLKRNNSLISSYIRLGKNEI